MFASNATNEQDDSQIVVKKERDPVVKSEKEIDQVPYVTESIPRFGSKKHVNSLQAEKENIIKELLTVKSDSQKQHLQLQHNQKEKLESNRLIAEQKQRINCLMVELETLKKKLNAEKLEKIEKMKMISSLTNDKKLLSAQVKQLQLDTLHATKSTTTKSPTESSSESDENFEVDRILSHKIMNKRLREFYVRWKGYSQEHDCWVKERDLHCPVILNAYLEQHNLKKQ